jgi:hypothetical protein
MDAQTQATEVESTGIKGADEFIAKAKELGLTVEVRSVRTEPTYYRDGSVMLPANLSVSVAVEVPVPEELNDTALGLVERSVRLYSFWNKRDAPNSRGRWTLASYSYLGGHEDMHVLRKAYAKLDYMAVNLAGLRKLAQD